jgi:hypothetical protein
LTMTPQLCNALVAATNPSTDVLVNIVVVPSLHQHI